LEVTLVIVVVGLTSGMLQKLPSESRELVLTSWCRPFAQIFIVMSGSPMPIKIGEKIHDLKYVQYVSPAFLQFNTSGGEKNLGIDRFLPRRSNGFVFHEGTTWQEPDDML